MRDPWAYQRWAFDQITGNVGRKTVLMALASMADMETGRCEAKHDTLARWAEISRRSVVRHIEALREAGLLVTRRQYRQDGSRRGDEYLLLAPWIYEWPDGQGVQSATVSQRDQSANGDHSKVPSEAKRVSQLAQQEQPPKNDRSRNESQPASERAWAGWDSIPDEMRCDGTGLLQARTKVNSKIVTEGEMLCAVAGLAEFNRQMESSYGVGAHLSMLVMRIREHPSWDPSAYVRLVRSAWRVRWWEKIGNGKRPDPRVVWGNAKVFEQVVQDAAAEAAGKRVEVEQLDPLKRARYSGGRSWDELTPREQAVARETFVQTGKAGEQMRDAAPITPSGRSITGKSLAAEILAGQAG